MLEVSIVIFTVIGAILLLNLLIALMASTYDRIETRAKQQVNYNVTLITRQLVDRAAIMPPPLNILIGIFVVILSIMMILGELMCCFRYQLHCFDTWFGINGVFGISYSLLIQLDTLRNEKNRTKVNKDDTEEIAKLKKAQSSHNEMIVNMNHKATLNDRITKQSMSLAFHLL